MLNHDEAFYKLLGLMDAQKRKAFESDCTSHKETIAPRGTSGANQLFIRGITTCNPAMVVAALESGANPMTPVPSSPAQRPMLLSRERAYEIHPVVFLIGRINITLAHILVARLLCKYSAQVRKAAIRCRLPGESAPRRKTMLNIVMYMRNQYANANNQSITLALTILLHDINASRKCKVNISPAQPTPDAVAQQQHLDDHTARRARRNDDILNKLSASRSRGVTADTTTEPAACPQARDLSTLFQDRVREVADLPAVTVQDHLNRAKAYYALLDQEWENAVQIYRQHIINAVPALATQTRNGVYFLPSATYQMPAPFFGERPTPAALLAYRELIACNAKEEIRTWQGNPDTPAGPVVCGYMQLFGYPPPSSRGLPPSLPPGAAEPVTRKRPHEEI